ncbi:MAG: methanogenesis marker 5 protein [Methanomassiliicoccaceae archaeon]|nr:methanogenesis marker 5 protein [Methanomassiliicoccaceae archaeon]
MKIFIDPPNSLILFDLVERSGHEPLSTMAAIQEKIDRTEIDMPPMNLSLEDVMLGLKYAGIEVPSGVRGRLAVWGPMIEAAEAAVIMEDCPYSFGCVGCHRANLMVRYMIKRKNIPVLNVNYPNNEDEATDLVVEIREFLEGLK